MSYIQNGDEITHLFQLDNQKWITLFISEKYVALLWSMSRKLFKALQLYIIAQMNLWETDLDIDRNHLPFDLYHCSLPNKLYEENCLFNRHHHILALTTLLSSAQS